MSQGYRTEALLDLESSRASHGNKTEALMTWRAVQCLTVTTLKPTDLGSPASHDTNTNALLTWKAVQRLTVTELKPY